MASRAPRPEDDIDRIMAVMTAAFSPDYGEAWTRAQVEGALLMGNCHYQLITADGNRPGAGDAAVGFALLRTVLDEEELLLLAVIPAVRRRGLGATLLKRVKADARARGVRRILLEMRRGNSAEALYTAQGFECIGKRPNYYRDRNGTRLDAHTFSCTLD